MRPDDHLRLFQKMDRIFNLTDEEKTTLADSFTETREYSAGEDIIRVAERPWASKLLVEGMVCRYRTLEGGRRQILAFQYPGDVFDAYSFVLERMDHSIATLSASRVAFLPHEKVLEVTEKYPRLARALWKDTLIDAAVFAEWMTNVRGKTPSAQIAHLLCEIFVRQQAVGLAKDDAVMWPMTNQDIADALGLSADYIQTTLEGFRASGFITVSGDKLSMHRLEDLKRLAEFDPAYLHLEPPRGPAGALSLDWIRQL